MADDALDPTLEELRDAELLVPVRSSGGGRELDASEVPLEEMRHGTDESGRFLAAYTSGALLSEYGPPGTDLTRVSGATLFELAAAAGERVVMDPGAPEQRELPGPIVALIAAASGGRAPSDVRSTRPPSRPAAPALPPVRAKVRVPELSAPGEIPDALADALRTALEAMPQVARAWLVRRGEGWTIGILQVPEATLSDFDEVRNRLHAVATEQLGTRRLLAVTDVRAPSLREQYEVLAPEPFYERATRQGFLGRLFGS